MDLEDIEVVSDGETESVNTPRTPRMINPTLYHFMISKTVREECVIRGPWVIMPRERMPKAVVSAMISDLTLKPYQTVGGIKRYTDQIKCYREINDPPSLLVPRAYLTANYGKPRADESSLGLDIDPEVRFEGSLRDARQAGFVQSLLDTMIGEKRTIVLGSAEPGCGKTVMFLYAWARTIRRKTLVIVHGMAIVSQWVGAVKRFCPGARVGVIHQNLWQVRNRDIVIASSDTLAQRAGGFRSELWREFGMVCFDEAHHILASTFVNIYCTCMHARYCVSLTGTPYRKDGLTHAMPYLIGPNVATMKNTDPVHVRVLEYTGGAKKMTAFKWGPAKGKPNEAAMISDMVEDEHRTHFLADILAQAALAGRKVLVLSARKDLRAALRLLVSERLEEQVCPTTARPIIVAREAEPSPAVQCALKLQAAHDAIYVAKLQKQPDAAKIEKLRADASRLTGKLMDVAPELMSVVRDARLETSTTSRFAEDESVSPAPVSWVEELCAEDGTLARLNKQQARVILATFVMAKEALDIGGLDMLVFATPAVDVKQAVGRIRRTQQAEDASSSHESDSVLATPHGLVVDLKDMFVPFSGWGAMRMRYYKEEKFGISVVRVGRSTEAWHHV